MRKTVTVAVAVLLSVPGSLVVAEPASAAGSSLMVTTLGRDGKPVATELRVVDVESASSYTLTSGHAQRLPRGTYDVMADIYTPDDRSDTVAARRVTMSAAHRITLDARQGRALQARLSPAAPAGYQQQVRMSVCGAGGTGVLGFSQSDVLYVVPSSARTVELAYSSTWQPADSASTGPRYLATTVHHGGLPSGGTMIFRQTSLASVTVSAHRGAQTGRPTIELTGRSSDICSSGTAAVSAQAELPYSFTARVTPGSWSLSEDGQDYVDGRLGALQAGHSYRISVNAATWGPGGQVPYTWSGHRIYLNTATLFADPSLTDYGGRASASYRLTRAGRTVYYRKVARDGATINPVFRKRGWYTLSVWAHRHPKHTLAADAQSTAAGVTMHFYADPAQVQQVRGYLTGFRPGGLSMRNLARPSTSTTVALRLLRARPEDQSVTRQSDSVRAVAVHFSTDGGRTWQVAAVRRAGGAWSAVVRNPASGYVSLRSTVTDAHGGSTTTTGIRAYGID